MNPSIRKRLGRKFIIVISVLLCGAGSEVNAQSLAKKCLDAIDANEMDIAASFVATLKRLNQFPDLKQVELCLSQFHGEAWVWDFKAQSFVTRADFDEQTEKRSQVLEEELANRKAEKEAQHVRLEEHQQRQRQALFETVSACYELLDKDRVSALTNSVCSPFFLELGLEK